MIKTTAAMGLCLVHGPVQALDWDRLWLNDDQRGAHKMRQEEYIAAARTFDDQRWRAAAWYRAGEYQRAAQVWAGLDDVEAHYNRANALARAGDLEGAIAAYETVLDRDPGHADARHNLALLRDAARESREAGSGRRQSRDGTTRGERDRERPAGRRRGDRQGQSPDRPPAAEQEMQNPESTGERSAGQSDSPQPARETERVPAADGDKPATAAPERQTAMEQWLRRIPDDPGGLLRRKFRYQYRRRQRADEEPGELW